jgi:hypothetical protein
VCLGVENGDATREVPNYVVDTPTKEHGDDNLPSDHCE